jgi:hypothetical protein
MKAVLLDWDTMGPGLDISKLQALLPDLEVFGDTETDDIATRAGDAAVVIGNKVRLTRRVFEVLRSQTFAPIAPNPSPSMCSAAFSISRTISAITPLTFVTGPGKPPEIFA